MLPTKCQCGWIPSVFHLKDQIWNTTLHVQVICENCHRRGKPKPTREMAIEEWNTNGPDETGIMK